MTNNEGSWDDGFEASWKQFRSRLADRLAVLEPEETIVVDAISGREEHVVSAPGIAFCGSEEGVWCGVNCSAPSTDDWDALMQIGWGLPQPEASCSQGVYDLGVYDLVSVVTTDTDWLAVMVVRALREVLGIVHPSFLETMGLEAEPEPEPDDEETDDDAAPISYPSCRDELVDLVDVVVEKLLGEPLLKDVDDDIPIRCGDSMVYVRVAPVEPVVELFAVVVSEVVDRDRALFEVNVLNRGSAGLFYYLHNGRVMARQRIEGSPFVPAQLRAALDAVCARIDVVADDLVARVGAQKFFDAVESEDEPAVAEQPTRRIKPSPSRTWMQTLANLEEDQPGSVDAQLAAHIFQRDQAAILEQIARQRRTGRPDMVALLRGALRVIVEDDARGDACR